MTDRRTRCSLAIGGLLMLGACASDTPTQPSPTTIEPTPTAFTGEGDDDLAPATIPTTAPESDATPTTAAPPLDPNAAGYPTTPPRPQPTYPTEG